MNNALGNCTLTMPKIQNEVIQCREKIIEEVGDDPYAVLVDECSDISHKEKLARWKAMSALYWSFSYILYYLFIT